MPVYDGDGFDEALPEEDFFPDDVAMVTEMLSLDALWLASGMTFQ